MCGNFGAIGPRINPQIIRTLGILNESRGRSSAGFFDSNGNIYKQARSITDMLKEEATTLFINSSSKDSWAICGHTRAPSCGSGVSTDNAHPFRYGRDGKSNDGPITGCHNGIIQHPDKCPDTGEKYTVDSQYIFHQLAKFGPGQYQDALGKVAGWYAIAWHDSRNKSIYLLNWKGDLHMVRIGSTIYYSSDENHLLIATGRKAEVGLAADGDVWQFTRDRATKLGKFTGGEWANARSEWARGTSRFEAEDRAAENYSIADATPVVDKAGKEVFVEVEGERYYLCKDNVWRFSDDADLRAAMKAQADAKAAEAQKSSSELDGLIASLSDPPADKNPINPPSKVVVVVNGVELPGEAVGSDLVRGDLEEDSGDTPLMNIEDEAEAIAAVKYINELEGRGYDHDDIQRMTRRKFPRLAEI